MFLTLYNILNKDHEQPCTESLIHEADGIRVTTVQNHYFLQTQNPKMENFLIHIADLEWLTGLRSLLLGS